MLAIDAASCLDEIISESMIKTNQLSCVWSRIIPSVDLIINQYV